MEVLLFILQKGGVGKTTSAAALASILTQVHHKQVLLISMDPQRNLDIICGASIPRGSEQPSMYHVLKGEKSLEEVLVQTPVGMLAPASNLMYQWTGTPLLSFEEYHRLKDDPKALMEQLKNRYAQVTNPQYDDTHRLERELKRIARKDLFDYVIVDSNPDLGYLTTLSLLCWPELKVIIPAFAEEASREAILELYDTIRVLERKDFNRKIDILGFLLTRYENVRIHRHYEKFMNRMAKKMNTQVFRTHIRKCVAVPEAMASKQDIWSYAPTCTAAQDYAAWTDEILKILGEG